MSGGIVLKNLPNGISQLFLTNNTTPINNVMSAWVAIGASPFEVFQMMFHIHTAGAAIEIEFDFAILPAGQVPPSVTIPQIWGCHLTVGSINNGIPIVVPRSAPLGSVFWYRFKNATTAAAVAFAGSLTILN